jgi:hypothetical protein
MMMKHIPEYSTIAAIGARLDPGAHRRAKGLRLVAAFGLAVVLSAIPGISEGRPHVLGTLAAGFALWASVSEARTTRYESARDLVFLNLAAGGGAMLFALLQPLLGPSWVELTLVSGSFCVGYFRRFDVLGSGIGSQIFIGQLLAYGAGVTIADSAAILLATGLATVASIAPRMFGAPAEQAALVPAIPAHPDAVFSEITMGLQAALASLAIVLLGHFVGLTESAWAITACTYVVASSVAGTIDRVWRRIAGTPVGVPLGLLCLPIAVPAPLIIWIAAAIALIVYAMALPEHYEIACGAYAFALVVTMGVSGQYPAATLVARGWETIVGGAVGIAVVLLIALLARAFGKLARKGP